MSELIGFYNRSCAQPEIADEALKEFAALSGDPTAPATIAARLLSNLRSRLKRAGDYEDGAIDVGHGRSTALDRSDGEESATAADGAVTLTLLGQWRPKAAPARRSGGRGATDGAAGALRAFRSGGLKAIREAEGPWACAIHDHEALTLTLSRSRDDGPPIYHFERDGVFWFGSRLPTLSRLKRFPAEIAPEAVSFYLAFGFPPSNRTLFESVRRLEPGEALHLADGAMRRDAPSPSPSLALGGDAATEPVAAFWAVIEASLAAEVADMRVAVLGAPSDPRTLFLIEALERAGAASAKPIADETIPALRSLGGAIGEARRLIAREGAPFASPALIALAARAATAAGSADVCVSLEGAGALSPTGRRYRDFAERLTRTGGAAIRPGLRRSSFHAGAQFARDVYFDQLAIFDDAARLALAGPLLARSNIFAMADELGSSLEDATCETAAERAWSLEDGFLGAETIVPTLAAARRAAGIRILAPFWATPVRAHLRAASPDGRRAVASAVETWPDDAVETVLIERLIAEGEEAARDLLDQSRFLGRGLFGRSPLNDMLERHFDGTSPNPRRIWALCCLELWFQECVDGRP